MNIANELNELNKIVDKSIARREKLLSVLELHKAIDVLVDINKKNRLCKDQLSSIEYLISQCTIRCAAGRNIGKTSYIGTHATIQDLIFVPNFYIKKGFLEQYGDLLKNNITTFNDLEFIRGRDFLNVYIDEPKLCFQNYDKTLFYQNISNSRGEHTIIMLGE